MKARCVTKAAGRTCRGGFTLIELLVALTITAIVLALLVPVVSRTATGRDEDIAAAAIRDRLNLLRQLAISEAKPIAVTSAAPNRLELFDIGQTGGPIATTHPPSTHAIDSEPANRTARGSWNLTGVSRLAMSNPEIVFRPDGTATDCDVTVEMDKTGRRYVIRIDGATGMASVVPVSDGRR